jgi:hypothetical protein
MAFADATALTPIALVAKAAVSVATLTAVDGTDGNKFYANANTLLRVKNASGSEITVTIDVTRLVEGQAVADDTFTVAATSGDVIYSGFSDIFRQNDAGEVHVTFSSGTSVTAQVLQL